MEGTIDYTEQLITLTEELYQLKELQIMSINNSIEFLKIGFVILGLFIGFYIVMLFVKVAFK